MLLLFLLSCGSNSTTDDTAAPIINGGWWSAPAGDADGDGYTSAQGDCNDGESTVYPGAATDSCDGLDNDCDGAIDEDSSTDARETNNSSAAYLGDLTNTAQTLISGDLHNEDDIDRYQFRVTDGSTTWFDIEGWLYSVPRDADYKLELEWMEDNDGGWQGLVDSSDTSGNGGFEFVENGGSTGTDDGGVYELRVTSVSGASCSSPYLIQILIGGA
jgi:hypothetical protein